MAARLSVIDIYIDDDISEPKLKVTTENLPTPPKAPNESTCPQQQCQKKPRKSQVCPVCGIGFVGAKKLFKHMRGRHGIMSPNEEEKPVFQCADCGRVFEEAYYLRQHARMHDPGRAYTVCQVCGKRMLADPRSVERHALRHASGDPRFTCSACGKQFSTGPLLREHQRVHSTAQHYCPYCTKSFNQMRNLTKHIRVHTGFKPVTCHICGKGCADVTALRVHERTHTGELPFKCTQCGHQFIGRQPLRMHMLTHTGERKFVCDHCGKRFLTRVYLKTHMVVHTGAKPYPCTICGKRFSRMPNMMRHRDSHGIEIPRKAGPGRPRGRKKQTVPALPAIKQEYVVEYVEVVNAEEQVYLERHLLHHGHDLAVASNEVVGPSEADSEWQQN